MSAFPKVGIVVLNYNGASCLLSCLKSLGELQYASKDIIVVDNDSADNSLKEAKEKFPQFTFVSNPKNAGFAAGMNVGIKLALARGADYCWLFNYDAGAYPETLAKLMEAARENPRAGLLSPVIYASDGGKIWFAKGRIDFFRMRTRHTAPTKQEVAAKFYPSEFLTGCALLIKKELVEDIGFLDENFFLYYEDADYSRRAGQAGFSCLVVPQAKVVHSEISNSGPQKIYWLVYAGLLFFQKWTPFYLRPYSAVYIALRRIKNWRDRWRGANAAQEVYRAYKDYIKNKPW